MFTQMYTDVLYILEIFKPSVAVKIYVHPSPNITEITVPNYIYSQKCTNMEL